MTADPLPPRHPRWTLPAQTPYSSDEVYDGDTVIGSRFERADFTGRDLTHTSFTECELVQPRFDDADLTGAHLVSSVLTDLDVAALTMPRAEWRQVRLQRSRLGSVVQHGSSWRDVEISDCKLGYLNARGGHWQDVTFRDCLITELDLGQARVERMRFERCRIDELHLTGARLQHVDLREAELSAIDGLAGLAGCTVSALQLDLMAPLLAAHLGLNVR